MSLFLPASGGLVNISTPNNCVQLAINAGNVVHLSVRNTSDNRARDNSDQNLEFWDISNRLHSKCSRILH